MHADVATIFLVIILMSFVLAIAIAAAGFRRHPELMLWSVALAMLGLAYLLLSLRAQISAILSIVVANVAISAIYAVFAEGLFRFFRQTPPRHLIWGPVVFTGISYAFLTENLQARIILGSLIFGLQGLLLMNFMVLHREKAPGRGKYIFGSSVLSLSCLMFYRSIEGMTGDFAPAALTSPAPLQTVTFLVSILSIMLMVFAQLLMTWERDLKTISDSEFRMRTLFESTTDAVMMLDENGFFDCNPATLRIFGCPSREVFISKHPVDLSPEFQPYGNNSKDQADFQISRALKNGSSRFEWIHCRIDTGETFHADVLLSAMDFSGRSVLQAVVRDISERKSFEKELERQAHLDYLTGTNNRRHFMHLSEIEVARAIRYEKDLAVLMLDIDRFKNINDTYGHKAGDAVLKQMVTTTLKTLREVDILGRLGGEEFAILLPETQLDRALEAAERLRAEIESTNVEIKGGESVHFTVSIGVTSLSSKVQSIEELLNQADEALYKAKNTGRNRVINFIPN